jgi:ATP-dependent protease ClpP protease subunit
MPKATPKLKFWNIVNSSEDEADLYVYGEIVNGDKWIYEFFGIEATDQVEFIKELNALGTKKNINVYINSPGGDVFAAQTIHNVLKRNPANITVYIDGIAASAASIIAMAGDKVIMPINATMMIHDPMLGLMGYFNATELGDMKDTLDQIKNSIVAAYMTKTKLSEKEIAKLMKDETWMTGKQAVELGFADEVLYDQSVEVVNVGKYAIINSLSVDMSKMKRNPFIQQTIFEGVKQNMGDVQNQNPTVPAQAAQAQITTEPQQTIVAPVVDYAAQERERLKAIDAIAAYIDPELVNEAKYGQNPLTAEQLAFRAMKEGKIINSGLFEQAVIANKAAGTEDVQAQTLPLNNDKELDLNNIKDVNAVFAAFAANSQAHRPRNLRRG